MSSSEAILRARYRGRADAFWLAREVLDLRLIEREVHGPIFDTIQSFKANQPPQDQFADYDKVPAGGKYQPFLEHMKLPGGRRRLILDPRGHYKTTINIVVHTLQWLLNYPNITLLVVHAKQQIAEDIILEIKEHLVNNRKFRDLYPEYCCGSIKATGSSDRIIVPCRTRIRREPSVGTSSIETIVAGYHYDVIKFSDIVTFENTGTKEAIEKTTRAFGMYRPVLVTPDCWIDVEGTCYDYRDMYNRTMETEDERDPKDRVWRIHVRGCYKKDTGGLPQTFTPKERCLPDLKDKDGNPVPWFPAQFSVHQLEMLRKDPTMPEYQFAAQYKNDPVDTSDDKVFPESFFKTKSANDMRKVPLAYHTTTVDTSETDTARADYCSVMTCGWDNFGRCYVVGLDHGRFSEDVLIDKLFSHNLRWKPLTIGIEETGYVRGLKAGIRRREDLRGTYLPLKFLKRDNQTAKQERIKNTLVPWFKAGEIYWLDSLDALDQAKQEMRSFPKYKDDILDTLADQFQERGWLGRNRTPSVPDVYSSLGDVDDYRRYVKRAIDRAQDDLLARDSSGTDLAEGVYPV